MNRLNIATNNLLFTALLAMTPAVFAAMLYGSSSVLAAVASSIAYVSVIVGERLDLSC